MTDLSKCCLPLFTIRCVFTVSHSMEMSILIIDRWYVLKSSSYALFTKICPFHRSESRSFHFTCDIFLFVTQCLIFSNTDLIDMWFQNSKSGHHIFGSGAEWLSGSFCFVFQKSWFLIEWCFGRICVEKLPTRLCGTHATLFCPHIRFQSRFYNRHQVPSLAEVKHRH